MFLLPSRLFVVKNTLFVSFNMGNIPRDMRVTSTVFHLPLLKSVTPINVYIKEIVTGWNEKGIEKGIFPTCSTIKQVLKCSPRQRELVVDITPLGKKWILSRKYNHGIYIELEKKNIKYLENNPPFLIVDTV